MSLRKLAYQKFVEGLHDGRIEMGGNYTQLQLCNILGVSTNPLQHALQVLENEGFVTIRARSGITVRNPDLNVYRECHQLRQILEVAAMPYYVEASNKEDIQALLKRIDRHAKTKMTAKNTEKVEAEQKAIEDALHRGLIASLRSETISQIYRTNWEKTFLIRQWPRRLTAEHRLNTAKEHNVILQAVLERDTTAAVAALQQHLLKSLERAIMTKLYA